jgi:hypothetical protein
MNNLAKSYYYLLHDGKPRLPLNGFSWNLIFEDFKKSVEKIHVSLKSDENKGYVT